MSLTFSPDGRSIAFWIRTGPVTANPRGEIRRMATTGGAAFTVAAVEGALPGGIAWDGDAILFGATGRGILRVSANSSEPELIVRLNPEETVRGIQVLRGGDALLFTTSVART